MSDPPTICDEILVELLAVLELSLLRYVGEAHLWIDDSHAEAMVTLERLAAEQHRSASEVAELLAARHLLPEMATYPSKFAQYHYLAMSFVLDKVIEDQESVVAVASDAVASCEALVASGVLRDVRNCERANLVELQRLSEELHRRQPV